MASDELRRIRDLERWRREVVDPWLRTSADFHRQWEPILSDISDVATLGRTVRRWSVRIVAALVAVSAVAAPWIDLALRSGGK